MLRTLLRTGADASYILNLCDDLLAQPSFRKYRFPFLVGDKGRTLPVDAYYPSLNLVVEYHQEEGGERSHDQRRRDVLLEHGVSFVELGFADFPHDGGRLRRFPGPIRAVLQARLEPFGSMERVLLRH